MAITVTARGTGTHNTSSATLVLSPTSDFTNDTTGRIMAVLVVDYDNTGGSGADPYSSISADSVGNTWVSRIASLNDPGAASAGVAGRVFTAIMSGGRLTTGSTITVNFSPNTTAKTWNLWEVAADAPNQAIYVTGAQETAATNAPTITTGSITSGDAVIGAVGSELGTSQTFTDDADASNGTWSTGQYTEIGTTTSGVSIGSQYKVVTGTGTQTYNPTLGTSADTVEMWVQISQTGRRGFSQAQASIKAFNIEGFGQAQGTINPRRSFNAVGASSGSTQLSLSVRTNDLIVAATNGNTSSVAISDDSSHSWALAETFVSSTTGETVNIYTTTSKVTATINVTFTYTATDTSLFVASYIPFIGKVWSQYHSNEAQGTNASPSSGSINYLAPSPNLAIGVIGYDTTRTLTLTSGYTINSNNISSGTVSASDGYGFITFGTTFSGNLSGTTGWATVAITFFSATRSYGYSQAQAQIKAFDVEGVAQAQASIYRVEIFPLGLTAVTDNFNRADANPIDGNWETTTNWLGFEAAIESNKMAFVGNGDEYGATWNINASHGFEASFEVQSNLDIGDAYRLVIITGNIRSFIYIEQNIISFASNQISPFVLYIQKIYFTTVSIGDQFGLRRIKDRLEGWYKPVAGSWTFIGVVPANVNITGDTLVNIGTTGSVSTLYLDNFRFDPLFVGLAQAQARIKQTYPVSYARVILADTPTGYWRLGESIGTNANDESANNYDGTYINTPTLGVAGALSGDSNTAVTFTPAQTEYIDVDPFTYPQSDVVSIEAWVKWAGSTYGVILDRGTNSYLFGVDGDGTLYFEKSNIHSFGNSTVALTPGQWYHVVITKNGSDVHFYIDGIDRTGTIDPATLSTSGWDQLGIGAGRAGSHGLFNGSLDEVAIYGYALSHGKVVTHYNVGSTGLLGPTFAQAQALIGSNAKYGYAQSQAQIKRTYIGVAQAQAQIKQTYPREINYYKTVIADTPIAYWRLGESSGNPQDSIGVRHVTVVGGTPTYSVTGAIVGDANTAITLDGATEYFEIPDHASLDPGDVFSLEAWITRSSTDAYVFSKGTNAYALRCYSSGLIAFQKQDIADIAESTINVPATGFHHVVATKNGADVHIYIDGVDVTGTVTNSTIVDRPDALNIGSRAGSSAFFGGSLDELAIYNYPLTLHQVAAHYDAKEVLLLGSTFAQAQARIKQTYIGVAQAQAQIKQTYNGFAQAQARIKQTYNGFAQAQARILRAYTTYAQAQANIKTTYNAFAQAQARILRVYTTYAQAQADIKQIYNGFAQAQADIKQVYNSFAQAQAQIKQVYIGAAQAQASIKTTYNVFAQSQARIKQTYIGAAQAQANIKQTYNGFAQAQGSIKAIYNAFSQAQADIKAVGYGFSQAQASIKQIYYGFAQAQARILAVSYGFAQAQARIKQTYNSFAQAQSVIKQTYFGFAQAQAFIVYEFYGQAQAAATISGAYSLPLTDTFTRSVTDGLGEADNGDTWVRTVGTDANADVNGTTGTIINDTESQWWELKQTLANARGYQISFEIAVDKIPVDIEQRFRFGITPNIESQGIYPGIEINVYPPSSGSVITASAGTSIITNGIGGYSYTPNDVYNVKASIVQASNNSVVIKGKFWKNGDPEPENYDTDGDMENVVIIPGHPLIDVGPNNTDTDAPFTWTFDNLHIEAAYLYGAGNAQAFIVKSAGYGQAQAQIIGLGLGYSQALARIAGVGPLVYLKDTFTRSQTGQETLGIPDIGNAWEDPWGDYVDETTIDGSKLIVPGYKWIEPRSHIPHPDIDVSIDFRISNVNFLLESYLNASYGYAIGLEYNTDTEIIDLYIDNIDRTSTNSVVTINVWYTFKYRVSKGKTFAKVWEVGTIEPDWAITDTILDEPTAFEFYAVAEGEFWLDNILVTENLDLRFGQAQALIVVTGIEGFAQAQGQIKTTYNAFAQSQALITDTYEGFSQAQASILAVGNGYAQAQARILTTYNGFGQAQAQLNAYGVNAFAQAIANIKGTDLEGVAQAQAYIHAFDVEGFAQSQAQIKQTYNSFAQSQAQIKTTYQGYGQTNADILQTYNSFAQAQASILAVSNGYGQSQANIKATYNGFGQAQALIGAVYLGFAQAQGSIKTTYQSYAQAQADILATYQSYAQAQAVILQTYQGYAQTQTSILAVGYGFAQAQAYILLIQTGFAQAQAVILQTYNGFAQSQAWIVRTEDGYGQSQARILQTYNSFAQAQGQIKQTYQSYAQAQADILATYNAFAQAQSSILAVGYGWSQAQARIQGYSFGQAQAFIQTAFYGFAQAQAEIAAATINSVAQAQASIKQTYNGFAQAQGNILAAYQAYAQAQALITDAYEGFAQAGAWIEQTYQGYGQGQASIKAVYNGYGQAQADVKATYNGYAQSQARIKTTYYSFAQAQAYIKLVITVSGQTQAQIKATYTASAQAQVRILATTNQFAQAQGLIKQTYQGYAQAQAVIKITVLGYAQAQALIGVISVGYAQAQGQILQTYRGYAQAQAYISTQNVAHSQAQAYIISGIALGMAQAYIKISHYLKKLVLSDRQSMNLVMTDRVNPRETVTDKGKIGLIISDRDTPKLAPEDTLVIGLTLLDRDYEGG